MTRKPQLTVLHVIDKLSMDGVNPSSCTLLFADWIPAFDPDRYRFAVCTLRQPDPAGSILEERSIPVHYRGHGKISLKNVSSIADLIGQEGADIVHLHGYSAANFGRLAARRKGVVNVVHEHAVLKVQPHQYLADRLLRSRTDAAIAVSQAVREFMISGRSIPAQKIEVIENGVNLEKFKRRDEAWIEGKRSEIGVPSGWKAVGTMTRLREEKGNEYLVRAIPGVLERCPETMFLIAGDGPLRGRLEALADELEIRKNIRFLGHVPDPAGMLSVFDVNAVPSLSEGFSLACVEAMAVGNPIVATEVGGNREVGTDGETVLFVPPRDPQALAARICQLVEDPQLAARLASQSVAASKAHGVENNVERLDRFYGRVLEARHAT